jgi:Putative metal-binding motif
VRAAPFAPGVLATLAALALAVACGTRNVPERVMLYDPDASTSDGATTDVVDSGDAGDDASPYLGGPCVDDAQCDDGIACTYDSCDQAAGRCLNVPDSSQCQDGMYCNGQEQCVPGHGCEPGPVVACDNGNTCETATCVESTQSCQYSARDLDGDGDPDQACPPGKDCNDLDPDVSSLHAEVCSNGIDDNCNGLIDEQPCVVPVGDRCSDAVAQSGAGTVAMSTVGCDDTYATSCSVGNPAAGQNVVAAITVPAGPNVDLELWATSLAGTSIAVAIDSSCGDPTTELACGSGGVAGATEVRARASNVAPGTYFAIVTTQTPGPLELEVDLLTPTPPPTNVDCGSATPITPGTPVAVSLVDPPTDVPSACTSSDGELTYAFTLTQPQDVLVYASTTKGSGTPVIGLRDPGCAMAADELECETSSSVPLYERSLPAGTYVVTFGGTAPIDGTFVVQLEAPTTAPADQTCASPPVLTSDQSLSFDLASHENAVKDGCLPSGPDAAYDLPLTGASDVLLIARIPETEGGGLSLDQPACTPAASLACITGSTPLRVGQRNVPAGDYRAVVGDELGLQGTLEALVRATVPPTILPAGGSATCAQAVDVSSGGFFTGDTSTIASAGDPQPCDAPSQTPAPEQVLTMTLAQPQRVVLDMEGSTFATLLNVEQGPSCPGTAVPNACYVGFEAERSFLDLELGAGQYWLVIEGYSGAKGPWNLDVRVLPP